MSKLPITDAPITRLAELEARFVRVPLTPAQDHAAPTSRREPPSFKSELEMRIEALRRAIQQLEEAHDHSLGLHGLPPFTHVAETPSTFLPAPRRVGAPKQLARLTDIVNHAMRWVPDAFRRTVTVRVENVGAPDVIVHFGQIVQVVVSLLVNAAEATRPGRPCVVIARLGPGGPGMARLEVIDAGAGLEGEGRDLGLAACQTIVLAHGGRLTVASEVGTGSTVRVEIPAATAG